MSSSMSSLGSATRVASNYSKRSRKFSPLRSGTTNDTITKLQGIVFDMDGTLCEPQNYMFKQMRDVLQIDKSTDILDHIHSLPSPEQDKAQEAIRAIERAAMEQQSPQPGLQELMAYLDERGIRKSICTRNFDLPITHLLTKFLSHTTFLPVVSREFKPPKPHPAGILHIASEWGLKDGGQSLIMVGDSIDDMAAGRAAGALTVLLVNKENGAVAERPETDVCVRRLDELVGLLEEGLECKE